ncbi:EAL domain-containing protein [Shewanella sp. HL-SH4]|uniref:EAL domain-containing protein n=1 Tax=Shewanella sp. HL-SH4 TaxID=3436240 RepID=UPI003EB84359
MLVSVTPVKGDDFVQRVFNTKDGLANSSVRDISFDRYGYTWLATDQGLYRVSSNSIRRMDMVGNDSVLNDVMLFQVESVADEYVLLASRSELYLYHASENRFTQLYQPSAPGESQSKTNLSIASIVKNQRNQFEILAFDGQRYLFDVATMALLLDPKGSLAPNVNWHHQLVLNSQESIYTTSHKAEWHLANGEVFDLGWSRKRGSIKGLIQDTQQRIWLVSSKGLFNIDLVQKSILPVDGKSFFIEKIVQDNKGLLWLGSRSGLISWNADTDETIHYDQSLKKLANIDYIQVLAIDNNNLIWIGGAGDGLALAATPPAFIIDEFNAKSKYQLKNDMVWSIYQQDNTVWLGTDGGVEVVDTVTKNAIRVQPDNIELNDSIYQISNLDTDHVLLSTTNGLFVVDKQTYIAQEFHQWSGGIESLRQSVIYMSYFDPLMLGRIWFATNQGLYVWQEGSIDIQAVPVEDLQAPKAQVLFRTMIRDASNRLWLGGRDIFGYLDENLTFTAIKDAFLPLDMQPNITHLMEVSPNILWIGTAQNGVFEYNIATAQMTNFNDKWNIECNVVMFLNQTIDDFLIGCSRAIIKVNKQTQFPVSFTQHDGFISDELNEGAVLFQPNVGLYVGTPDGAMLIAPELLVNRIVNKDVFLESVSIYYDDRTDLLLLPEMLKTVEPGASLVSFQISNLDYLDESPISLKYRLLERGEKPSSFVVLEGQYQINVSGLNAGEYTLELHYKKNNIWSSHPFQFSFKVEEYWWQSKIFRGVLLFIILFLAFILSFYRHRQVMRFQKVNQALIESDDRLSQALRGSDSDLWDWCDSSKMFSLENRGGLLGNKPKIFSKLVDIPIHPDDVDHVTEAWLELIKSRAEMIDVDFRYRHESKGWRWLRVKGRAIAWLTNGRLSRAAGIYSDITLQRELESEVNLLAEAFENTSEGMLILDADKCVKISNLAANQMLGIKEPDLVGKPFSSLILSNPVTLNIDKLFRKDNFWSGERELLCADNRTCPVWLNISKMLNSTGAIQHYVVVFSDMSERKQNELKLQHLANNDPLTGLANRSQFVSLLNHVIENAGSSDEKLALMFLDLDRFKSVNDSFGHSMGDALLVEAANRLQSCLHADHLLCRFGGDEFVILLRNADDIDQINHLASQLLIEIQKPFKLYGREFFISTSIGISCWPEDCQDSEALIKNADLAMYHAKDEGRGNFQYYSAERNSEALYHLRLESDLRKAIERDEFELHYQPQIDILHDDRCIGMEALIRWKHPIDGYIRPDIFIHVAESCGLIIDIDTWVLKQACLDGARWYQHYGQEFKLSVNVSAVQFRQIGFIESVKCALAETGFPPTSLCLEITEGVLMKEIHVAIQHLSQLKALGIQVAIDDFGTGYSSLAYLRSFEVNTLKIDRSFLIQIAENQADQAIVSSIIELARNLKLQVVAEGIETKEQLEQVFSRGCYIIQGYYFAKPMPRSDLDTFLGIDTKEKPITFHN